MRRVSMRRMGAAIVCALMSPPHFCVCVHVQVHTALGIALAPSAAAAAEPSAMLTVAKLKATASLLGAAPYARLPMRLLPDALVLTVSCLWSLLARLRAAAAAATGAAAASDLAAAVLAALRCMSAGLGGGAVVPAVSLALAEGERVFVALPASVCAVGCLFQP
jgi:hypothetical protein